jgi:RHS repeat-associated protein
MNEGLMHRLRQCTRAMLAAVALVLLAAGPADAYHYPWDQGHDTTVSADVPETGTPQQPACEPSCSINGAKALGSPAYAASGHAYWQAYDLALRGRPFIGIYRVYNSNDPVVGLFGNGWAVDFDIALYPALAGSQVQRVFKAANGKRIAYTRQPDGSYRAPAGRFETVVESASSVSMTMPDGRRFVFAPDGRLLQRLDANGNAVAFSYDTALRLTGIGDGRGRTLALAYNGQGFVASVTDHSGRAWRYAYDAQGNLASVTDALGGITRYTWQAFKPAGDAQTYYQLLTATDPSGVVMVSYTYSGNQVSSYTEGSNRISYTRNSSNTASGGTVTRRDSMSVTTTFDYGALGLITREVSGIGATVRHVYDANGRITQTTDALGRHWSRSWDTLGRLTGRSNPLGQTGTLQYAGNDPRPVRITSPAGRVMQMSYDSRGNLVATTDPAGAVSQMSYDARGDLRTVRNALTQQADAEYTDTGLPLRLTDALGRQTLFTHDALGRVATVTNAAGEVTRYAYDALDRVSSIVNALGQTTSFAYDAVGRITRVTDAKGSITRYEYDSYGRRTAEVAPDGRRTTYLWRLDNLLERVTWPDNTTISYLYDSNKRMTRETAGSEQINYTYNAANQLLSATGPGGTVSYTYDDAGRVASETSGGRTNTITRNADGERVGLAFLGQTQTYTRDSRGRVTRIASPAGNFDFGYDALGRRTQLAYPNGSSAGWVFDAAGQLTNLSHAGVFNAAYAYSYDAAGRPTRTSGDGADWTYTSDALGRLTRAAQGSTASNFTLDAMGNISNLGDGSRVHDANHRLTADATKDYSWDSRGNLTLERNRTSGARVGYTWNVKNQLLRVEFFANAGATTPTRTLQFSWDPLGRRASKTDNGVVQRFVHDGDDLVGVLDAANAIVATHVFSGAIDEPLAVIGGGTTRLLYVNAQQSVVAVSAGASLTHTYRYGPYGETLAGSSADSVPFRYTGREKDTDELYHYRARSYHTQTRQFLSADPIGLLGGMNPYRYVKANPVAYSDPFGLYGFGDFASDASSATSWLYGGAKSAAGGAYTWATAWHFEGRAARNSKLPTHAQASTPGSGWRLMPQSENTFHDNGDAFPEEKYVSDDGREVIFDGYSHHIVTDPCLIGTYNYIVPGERPKGITDLWGIANYGVRGLGHWVADVVPYAYGGNVRGWD